MRSQECRKHIQKTGKVCKLKEETIKEVQRVLEFCEEHPTLSDLSTDAAEALMRIPDPVIQQKAISVVGKTLNRKTPTGGVIKKRLTRPEVEKVIKKVSPPENVEKESGNAKPPVSDPLPASPYVPAPGSIEVSDKVQPSLAEQERERKLPLAWTLEKKDLASETPEPGINPVPPAFKTGNEVKQGLTAPERPAAPADPQKAIKERRVELADELMSTYSERFQMGAREYLRYNNKGARTNADFFYFAGEALVEKGGKK